MDTSLNRITPTYLNPPNFLISIKHSLYTQNTKNNGKRYKSLVTGKYLAVVNILHF